MNPRWMTAEEVIAQWIKNHPHISTPEWGAQNLISDLDQYDYIVVNKYDIMNSEDV